MSQYRTKQNSSYDDVYLWQTAKLSNVYGALQYLSRPEKTNSKTSLSSSPPHRDRWRDNCAVFRGSFGYMRAVNWDIWNCRSGHWRGKSSRWTFTEWVKGAAESWVLSAAAGEWSSPWRKRRRGTNYNLHTDMCVKIWYTIYSIRVHNVQCSIAISLYSAMLKACLYIAATELATWTFFAGSFIWPN